jgi:RNA polymerase sigma-70 factor (ECF subfamily)
MRAAIPGDLEALMKQYSGRVYRCALRITRNRADAEDVVQDVFLAVFRKHTTFEGRSAFGSWLYRIAVNAALNRRRGKRVRLETSLEQLAQRRDGDVPAPSATVDARTPDERALAAEARAIVDRAVDRLPDHYRALIVLRDLEERTGADVADILHESAPCLKTRLHRARLALRERLTPYVLDRVAPSDPASSPYASRETRARLP